MTTQYDININNLEFNMADHAKVLQNAGAVYLFSNENVPETLVQAGRVRDKRVLTVAASGDQAIEAYHMGAAQVDTFDFNILQSAVVDLKVNAIRHLDREEFFQFMLPGERRFNLATVKKLEQYLSPVANQFIQMYYENPGRMLRTLWYDAADIRRLCYGAANKFERLKDCLPPKINFIHTDIRDLSSHLTQRYDIILLSNIFTYAYPDKDKTSLMAFYTQVLKPLADNYLSDGGCIGMQYSWGYEYMLPVTQRWQEFLDSANKQIRQNNHFFDLCFVFSQLPNCNTDAVTFLRKIKTR